MKLESRGENHCRELCAHYVTSYVFTKAIKKTFSEFYLEIDELFRTFTDGKKTNNLLSNENKYLLIEKNYLICLFIKY